MNTPSADVPRRIAILAVHGVADQKPGDTTTAIAHLLLGLDPEGRSAIAPTPSNTPKESPADEPREALYSGFDAVPVHVPVRPVIVPRRGEVRGGPPRGRRWKRWLRPFDERHGVVAELHQGPLDVPGIPSGGPLRSSHPVHGRGAKPDLPAPGHIDYEYLRSQLESYGGRPDGQAYATTRLEGRRGGGPGGGHGCDPPGQTVTDVHLYEVYWGDLSRLGTGVVAFFGALYQLVLHIASLGRQVVDAARDEHRHEWYWRAFQDAHTWAVRWLVLFVPVLNVVLLIAGLGVIPASQLGDERAAATARLTPVVLGAIAGFILAYRIFRHRVPRKPIWWVLAPFMAAAIGALIGLGVARIIAGVAPHKQLLVEWWLIGWVLLAIAARVYERVRPGANLVAHLSYVTTLVLLLYLLQVPSPDIQHQAERVTLWTMQPLYAALTAVWMLFLASALAAFGASLICGGVDWKRSRGKDPDCIARYARTVAVIRTSRVTLALAVLAVLVTLLIVWSGLFTYSVNKLNAYPCLPATAAPLPRPLIALVPSPSQVAHWLPPAALDSTCGVPGAAVTTAGLTDRQYLSGLLVTSATTGIPVLLSAFAVALFLVAWMAIPSVAWERTTPGESMNRTSVRGGQWLSRGLDATWVVIWVCWTGAIVVLLWFGIHDALERLRAAHEVAQPHLSFLARWTLPFVHHLGAWIAASGLAILGMIAKYGGAALDVVLDVDNYLRTGPAASTPAARIAERYVSLLRYVGAFCRDGRGYDSIIIVSHSLGTAITADLLRVLHRQANSPAGDPTLAAFGFGVVPALGVPRTPIYLFTMGSPLRQLMGRFFPHRFRWVRPEPDNGYRRLSRALAKAPADPVDRGIRPDPAELGVRHWSNAYRSGDYVGRSLWINEWYSRTAAPGAEGAERGGYPDSLTAYAPPSAAGKPSRWEACIGVGAHTHYWDRTAPDVAERLDELVRMALAEAPPRGPGPPAVP